MGAAVYVFAADYSAAWLPAASNDSEWDFIDSMIWAVKSDME